MQEVNKSLLKSFLQFPNTVNFNSFAGFGSSNIVTQDCRICIQNIINYTQSQLHPLEVLLYE